MVGIRKLRICDSPISHYNLNFITNKVISEMREQDRNILSPYMSMVSRFGKPKVID